jgi:outer membrane immunogenic protein
VQGAEVNPETAAVSWTGFYVGGNVGYSRSKYVESNRTGSAGGVIFIPGVGDLTITPGSADLAGGSLGSHAIGAGAQIGVNYQIGRTVLGLEADIQSTTANASLGDSVDIPGGLFSLNSQISTKTDWIATMRGRVGYSSGTLLPYVTGGLALSHVESTITNAASIPGFPVDIPQASSSISKTPIGYAVGGGLEYAAGHGWSVKGEYLHLAFASQSYDFNSSFSAPIAGLGTLNGSTTAHADIKTSFDIFRLGANYHF